MSNKIALKSWESWNPRQQTYRMSRGQYNSRHFWCNDVGRKKVVVQCGDMDRDIFFEIANDVKPFAETKKQDDGTEIKVIPEKEHKENMLMMCCPDDHPLTAAFTQWDSDALAMCQEQKWWGEDDDPPVVLKKSYTGCWRSMPKKDKADEHQPLFKAKIKLVGADATKIILLDEDEEDEDGNMMYDQREEPGTREDLIAGAMVLPMVRIPKVYSTESKWGFTKEVHEIYVLVPKATGPTTMVSNRVRKKAPAKEKPKATDAPASPKRRLTSEVAKSAETVVPNDVEPGTDSSETEDSGSAGTPPASDGSTGTASPAAEGAADTVSPAAEAPAATTTDAPATTTDTPPTANSGRRRNRLSRSFGGK